MVTADFVHAQRRGGGGNWSGGRSWNGSSGNWRGGVYVGPGYGYYGRGYGYYGRGYGYYAPYYGSYYYGSPATSYYYEPETTTYVQPAAAADTAHIRVLVPDANARVWFDGALTQQSGTDRMFHTPSLTVGSTYNYRIRASWMQGNREMTQERTVSVTPGATAVADFTQAVN
jgi:uncharacterized protein (TIGR03000 family)